MLDISKVITIQPQSNACGFYTEGELVLTAPTNNRGYFQCTRGTHERAIIKEITALLEKIKCH